jgi:hypothetical protein
MNVVIVLVAGLMFFLPLLLVSFRLFDELLQVQFSDAHSEWERYESPSGYFWKAPASRHLSLRQRGDLWSFWYRHRPQWVDSSEGSRRLYRRFKLVGRAAIVAFVPVFAASCLLLTIAVVEAVAFVARAVW